MQVIRELNYQTVTASGNQKRSDLVASAECSGSNDINILALGNYSELMISYEKPEEIAS